MQLNSGLFIYQILEPSNFLYKNVYKLWIKKTKKKNVYTFVEYISHKGVIHAFCEERPINYYRWRQTNDP